MPKINITENQRYNFQNLQDARRERADGLMVAYDKKRNEKVLLFGSIFQNSSGRNEFAPHAEIIDLTEEEAKKRYALQTDDEFEELTQS